MTRDTAVPATEHKPEHTTEYSCTKVVHVTVTDTRSTESRETAVASRCPCPSRRGRGRRSADSDRDTNPLLVFQELAYLIVYVFLASAFCFWFSDSVLGSRFFL